MLNAQFALHVRDCAPAHLGIGSVRFEDPLYPFFKQLRCTRGWGLCARRQGMVTPPAFLSSPTHTWTLIHIDREEWGEKERFKTGKERGIFKRYLENVLCMSFQIFCSKMNLMFNVTVSNFLKYCGICQSTAGFWGWNCQQNVCSPEVYSQGAWGNSVGDRSFSTSPQQWSSYLPHKVWNTENTGVSLSDIS